MEMKNLIIPIKNEITDEISRKLREKEIPEFAEGEEWAKKEKVGQREQVTPFRDRVIEALVGYLTDGLVRLTIEEISETDDCKGGVAKKARRHKFVIPKTPSLSLGTFYPYLDIIVHSGALEVWRKRVIFKVEPVVTVQNVKITARDGAIEEISFGSFLASLNLYLCRGTDPVHIHSFNANLVLPTLTF